MKIFLSLAEKHEMKFTSKKALADHKALPHILLEEHGQYCWKSTPLQESQFLHGDIYEKKENEHQSCPPIRRLSVILNLEGAFGSTKGVQYHDHEHHYYSSGKYLYGSIFPLVLVYYQ